MDLGAWHKGAHATQSYKTIVCQAREQEIARLDVQKPLLLAPSPRTLVAVIESEDGENKITKGTTFDSYKDLQIQISLVLCCVQTHSTSGKMSD